MQQINADYRRYFQCDEGFLPEGEKFNSVGCEPDGEDALFRAVPEGDVFTLICPFQGLGVAHRRNVGIAPDDIKFVPFRHKNDPYRFKSRSINFKKTA